jgi:hypothetical protein
MRFAKSSHPIEKEYLTEPPSDGWFERSTRILRVIHGRDARAILAKPMTNADRSDTIQSPTLVQKKQFGLYQ